MLTRSVSNPQPSSMTRTRTPPCRDRAEINASDTPECRSTLRNASPAAPVTADTTGSGSGVPRDLQPHGHRRIRRQLLKGRPETTTCADSHHL
jgi:hypothetical protein